jgi:hypothetical protein
LILKQYYRAKLSASLLVIPRSFYYQRQTMR